MNNILRPTRNRAIAIVAGGIFLILALVALMNLESPRIASKAKANKVSDAVTPPAASEPRIAASHGPAEPKSTGSEPPEKGEGPAVTVQPLGQPPENEANPPAPSAPAPSTPPPAIVAPVTEEDIARLKSIDLLIPVEGIKASQLRDNFYDGRSEGRQHFALDIMAQGGTPVLAAADGKVAKLFQSAKGGITLYQLDSSGLYYYYYAHLARYADGMTEGRELKRGEVIAYVGDTGNAGLGNYHLHFAISRPTAPGKWSGGTPIDPYPLLAGK